MHNCSITITWLNFTQSQTPPQLMRDIGARFTVIWLPRGAPLEANGLTTRRHIACFDFDDPNPEGLAAVSELKQRHASIPVLMLTLHHDEALMLWALRARVWNLFVKPTNASELIHNVETLRRSMGSRMQESSREILRPLRLELEAPDENNSDRTARAVAKAKQYVEAHLAEDINARAVAQRCCMSYFHFSRSFKRQCGESFTDFVHRERVRRAAQLLKTPNARISRVCIDVGFRDVSYFARVFRQLVGMSPIAWRDTMNGSGRIGKSPVQARIIAAPPVTPDATSRPEPKNSSPGWQERRRQERRRRPQAELHYSPF